MKTRRRLQCFERPPDLCKKAHITRSFLRAVFSWPTAESSLAHKQPCKAGCDMVTLIAHNFFEPLPKAILGHFYLFPLLCSTGMHSWPTAESEAIAEHTPVRACAIPCILVCYVRDRDLPTLDGGTNRAVQFLASERRDRLQCSPLHKFEIFGKNHRR